ncbi:hypothetical protein BDV95DRAFT_609984 [Massariosphaeria phaeospora]|uniref:Uncharacterized protein n=1 Tax=Massariosphaeria phaeospora TaxID=100035 RepID=A0A7C8IAL1_9PLEO|nr:hypothetical protein BDV95DRAFT_609984 [Massariosphaeria phaeospora]
MPPKKATAARGENGEPAGDDKFRWTAEHDRTLLILTMGRTLAGKDYHDLVQALPGTVPPELLPAFSAPSTPSPPSQLTHTPGTNFNGVRIRVSKLRIEQRKLMTELGWDLPEFSQPRGATKEKPEKKSPAAAKAKGTGKKRPAKALSNVQDADEIENDVVKKPKFDDDDDDDGPNNTFAVKKEAVADDDEI